MATTRRHLKPQAVSSGSDEWRRCLVTTLSLGLKTIRMALPANTAARALTCIALVMVGAGAAAATRLVVPHSESGGVSAAIPGSRPTAGDTSRSPFPSSATSVVLKEQAAGVANVRDFGAKGDWLQPAGPGSDDTWAFQAAIESGKPVYVPTGVYLVSGPLYLPAEPGAVRMFGFNDEYGFGKGVPNTRIVSTGKSLFLPAGVSIGNWIPRISMQLSGLAFESKSLNTVAFDKMTLAFSRISDCHFLRFKHILRGKFMDVSSFDHNSIVGAQGSIFTELPVPEFNPNLVAGLVDSSIRSNYLNSAGYVPMPDFAAIDIHASNSIIEGNYIDFAHTGIRLRDGSGDVGITNNTFTHSYRGIDLDYGTSRVSIVGNQFAKMRKSEAVGDKWFKHPNVAMKSTEWTCIYLGQGSRDITIIGNTFRNSERFIDMPHKWYKNIRELGNVGGTEELTGPLVRMDRRSIDDTGFVAAGDRGDGTGFFFESMEGKSLSALPDSVRESYEGRTFRLAGALIATIGGRYVDAGGVSILSRSNLAPANDFAMGWSSSAGFRIQGGKVMLDGTMRGWKASHTLESPLAPGGYLIGFATLAGTSGASSKAEPGIELDDGSAVIPAGAATAAWAGAEMVHLYLLIVPDGRIGNRLRIRADGVSGSLGGLKVLRLSVP